MNAEFFALAFAAALKLLAIDLMPRPLARAVRSLAVCVARGLGACRMVPVRYWPPG
jgi:hypothetical protein